MSFIQNAANRATDIRSFLAQADNKNSLKYASECNATHIVYIPYRETTVVADGQTKTIHELNAFSTPVHEWNTPDGKYHATVCLDGYFAKDEQGNLINDGSCPFCNRISDAWEIFNYRKQLSEAANLGKKDAETKNADDRKVFLKEMKISKPTSYLYMLIAKFKLTADLKPVINATTQLPEFELKVMKLSQSRAENIRKSIENTGLGVAGSEVVFGYKNTDDPRQLTSTCTTSPVFPASEQSIIGKYPAVKEVIQQAANEFSWDVIDKTFQEFKAPAVEEAKAIMNANFKQYDSWKLALTTNPNAQYLEYVGVENVSQPALETSVPNADTAFADNQAAVNLASI